MARKMIHGACPHDCPDTCGVITEVENGRAVKFYGDPDHPITQGWLCAKVRPYLDHVYHPDRLRYPLRRVGPKGGGRWERISWAEASAEIAERWQEIIRQYGAEAILPYSYSGTLGLVQTLLKSTLMTLPGAASKLGSWWWSRTLAAAAGCGPWSPLRFAPASWPRQKGSGPSSTPGSMATAAAISIGPPQMPWPIWGDRARFIVIGSG